MVKTMLVVFMLMNDGSVKNEISQHQYTCPSNVIAEYERKKFAKEIQDYAASCVVIRYTVQPRLGV